MRTVKRIVCLANSRTMNGRCVAGREWRGGRAGPWIRPVGAHDGREVSEYERQYEDGSDPCVLDVVDVPMLEPRPHGYQTENWLLDDQCYWEKAGRLSPLDLAALRDPADPLWVDGHSTWNGRNDKIPVEVAGSVTSSLRLLHVDALQLVAGRPGEAFGNNKRRVQGRFEHAGREYRLWVTDPGFERRYLAKLDGAYPLGGCHLTISLGEPFGDACHKLIAAIVPDDPHVD